MFTYATSPQKKRRGRAAPAYGPLRCFWCYLKLKFNTLTGKHSCACGWKE